MVLPLETFRLKNIAILILLLLNAGLLVLIGVFAGIFVGCLSIALSEVLDGIPIFARRIRLKMGVSIAVLMVAVGKIAGSIVYFINGFFEGI